ncbi:MAG: hypothetical protein ACTH3S_15550, partial [Marinobacter sp.]|uniref:hypothetical protein n=1 Tax=Marinobacter sp. TaxID=50741 RepID=UPI003F97C12A
MSEHQSNANNTSNGLACEGEKLIVEVMGTEHPDPHTFRIYDRTNQQQQEWLENKAETESLDAQQLHCWPWEGKDKKNVWLDIASEEGAPVRVSLFSDVEATPRQSEAQWNRIWPVVPLTLLHDQNPAPGLPKFHPVPVRPGFIYIFREGTLWRELEVTNTDSGQLTFSDVRLTDYRSAPGQLLNADHRPPVGSKLESVWLPVRGMAQPVTDAFELAFSEVQWSSDRVIYLEQNASARSQRCAKPGNPDSAQIPDAAGQWASVSDLPEMRARESYLEQHLPKPWESIHDLSGSYSNNLFGQAVREQKSFAADSNSAKSAYEAANYRDASLRGASSLRVAALEVVRTQACDGLDDQAMWQPLGGASDALASIRERGWHALVLDDLLFQIRHRLAQATDAQRYLTTLTGTVGEQPNTDSAQLIYRVMGPAYLGGKENPLHKHLEEIETGLFSKLHLTLRTAQRQVATEDLAVGQQHFVQIIERPENQWALADLFSLQGADYIEGFALAQQFVQVLAMNPRTADKLRINEANVEKAYTDRAHKLLVDILSDGSSQPLHVMLFPAGDGDEMTDKGETDENCGDGRCRPRDIEAIAKNTPDTESLQTLSAVALAGIAKHESLNLTTQLKRWITAVNTIFDGIQKSSQAALTTLKSHAYQINARLYGPLLRMAKARDPKLLGAVKLVPRSSVPANWVVLGVTDPKGGLTFGLTEADRQEYINQHGRRRFYGEFYQPDSNTPLGSTNRSRMPNLGATAEARDVHVFAAPASAEVTDTHRKLRRYKRWDEIADNIRLPYFIVVIEAFNIWNERDLYKKTAARNGKLRANVGMLSAGIDLFVASTLSAERLLLDVGKWRGLTSGLNSTAFSINHDLIARASQRLADFLPRVVSYRLLGGIVSGGVTAIVSLMDMVHEIDTGDGDAALAHGASALGGGMMLMGGLMFSSAASSSASLILLGMGPAAWLAIGIALAIGGGIAAVMLNDPPLVDWLKRGPFGTEQDDMYGHLANDPAEAYYRLVGLLSQPRILMEQVRNLPVKLLQNGVELDAQQERRLSQVNCKVRIENNVSSFLDESNLVSHLRLVTENKTISNKPSSNGFPVTRRSVQKASPDVLLEQPLANGRAYYIALPPDQTSSSLFQTTIKGSSVAVRAQWHSRWSDDE